MDDRRKEQRYKVMGRIAVLHLPERPGPLGPTIERNWHTTVDVSTKGLRFKSTRHIQDESFLRIDILMGQQQGPIVLPAIVKWSHKRNQEYYFDVGVELLDVDDEHHNAWTTYIDHLCEHPDL